MSATAFVIKSWSAASQPDANGKYVHIAGRAGGFVAWLLNVLGISPTVSLIVHADRLVFQKGSLEGTLNFITPLENTCSTFYAFKRSLKEAVILGLVLGAATFFSFGIIGIAIAILFEQDADDRLHRCRWQGQRNSLQTLGDRGHITGRSGSRSRLRHHSTSG